MFLVDTNVFVYAVNHDAPEREACLPLLGQWHARIAPWYTTWQIIYEFLRVTTHARVFPRPLSIAEAWQFIAALLASPGLRILGETPRHPATAAAVFDAHPHLAGSILHDAHTVILMREHGIRRIYTRDADFSRFSDLEVIDPLAGSGTSARSSGTRR